MELQRCHHGKHYRLAQGGTPNLRYMGSVSRPSRYAVRENRAYGV
jgi:hypothetical protein